MNKKEMRKHLSQLFTVKKFDDGEERIIYSDKYLSAAATTPEHEIYEAVSAATFESELPHGFSYEIASRAVDILAECEDWSDDDDIRERVDNAVPCYTSQLMEIYAAASWAVDEAVAEFGHGENSDSDAARAWYMQIERMAAAIVDKLESLETDDDNK